MANDSYATSSRLRANSEAGNSAAWRRLVSQFRDGKLG